MKEHDKERAADPEDEGVRALEQTEAYFKHRREQLETLHEAFVRVGAPPSHAVFRSLDRLDKLYVWIVATMQDVRWSVLVFDGVRDRADSPEGRAFATSSDWLASLDGD